MPPNLVEQQAVKGKQLMRFAREDLYPVPRLLEVMGLAYDEKLGAFKTRITKQFPERFAEWVTTLPKEVETQIDGRLKTSVAPFSKRQGRAVRTLEAWVRSALKEADDRAGGF